MFSFLNLRDLGTRDSGELLRKKLGHFHLSQRGEHARAFPSKRKYFTHAARIRFADRMERINIRRGKLRESRLSNFAKEQEM